MVLTSQTYYQGSTSSMVCLQLGKLEEPIFRTECDSLTVPQSPIKKEVAFASSTSFGKNPSVYSIPDGISCLLPLRAGRSVKNASIA